MKVGLEFSPIMVLVLLLSFLGISFFVGMLVHSSFMYEDKQNLKRDSKKSLGFEHDCWGGDRRLDVSLWLLCKLFMRIFLIINRPKVGLNDYIRF